MFLSCVFKNNLLDIFLILYFSLMRDEDWTSTVRDLSHVKNYFDLKVYLCMVSYS